MAKEPNRTGKNKTKIFLLCPTLFFKLAPVLVVKTKIFFKFRNYSLQIPVKLHITTNFLGKIAIKFQFFHHVIDKNSYFFHSSLQVSTSNSNDAFLALFLLLMNKKNKNKKTNSHTQRVSGQKWPFNDQTTTTMSKICISVCVCILISSRMC